MKKIAEGNNPHVITFIGCVTIQEPLCLITEFVKYGDLLSYLETIRKLVMLMVKLSFPYTVTFAPPITAQKSCFLLMYEIYLHRIRRNW